MKLTSLQKLIGAVVLIAIVAIVAVVVLILPQFSVMADLDAQKAAAQISVDQAKSVLAQLQAAKSQAALTDAALLKAGTMVPDSPQLPTLIIEMQDIANSAGVTVTHFGPSVPAATTGAQYTEIPLSLTVNAHWDDLLDYLRRINDSTRLLRVSTIAITPPAATSTTETVTEENQLLGVTLSMKAYVIGNNGVLSSQTATSTTATATTTTGQ
jgi:Tfp pilus assembly protein PilO